MKMKSIQSCVEEENACLKTWTLKQMIEIKHGLKESTYGKRRHRGRRKITLLIHEQEI